MGVFRFLVLATAAAGGVLLAPAMASAHAVEAKVTVAQTVKVEVFFDDDTPAEFADVVITDANGATVFTGKTNERGVWTFPAPKPGKYLLTAKAVGHIAKVEFSVEGKPPVTYTGWQRNRTVVTVAATVKVEAFFDDDTLAERADVTVTDANGATVFTGKTDERGEWTFPAPAPGEYTLTVKSIGRVAKQPFRVEGEPNTAPVTYTGWRMNKTVALVSGVGLLLGLSAVSWFLQRRRRGVQ